jgi:hypothetical protein
VLVNDGPKMLSFRTEKALTEALVHHLRQVSCPWGRVRVAREFFYHRGRTDVVALTSAGRVLAFEAKLKDWREALHQAYRNSCFAHGTYVVLPKSAAELAHRYSAEFQSLDVGLCVVSRNALEILCEAETLNPIQPWLSRLAAARAMSQCRL